MIDSDVRTLRLGSTSYVWVQVLEKNHEDVTAITPDLRTISPAGVVSSWAPADPTLHLASEIGGPADTIRCAILHVAAELGWWQLEARLEDNPETDVLAVGGFRVVP